ncbi:MAG: DUF4123 domain-containing protein [Pirellulales bacterium]
MSEAIRPQVRPRETLEQSVAEQKGKWFAVLDACDEPAVFEWSIERKDRSFSLYRGNAEQNFYDIAPYIFQLDVELLGKILDDLAGKPWGFLATGGMDLALARRHFRNFLMIDGPDSEELYFRFYDPRVLHPFLRASDKDRLTSFFGPASAIILPDEDDRLLEFHSAESSPEAKPKRVKLHFAQTDCDEFSAARQTIFRERLADHIKQQHPKLPGVKPDELDGQVQEGINRGLRYEFRKQSEIAVYVELMISKFGKFQSDRDPLPIRNILFDRRMLPEERFERLAAFDGSAQSQPAQTGA